MSRKTILLGALFLVGKVSTAQQAVTAIDTNNFLPEVVITASKIPLSSKESSKPVLVITKEMIQRSSGKDLAQVLNEQPGVVVNGANSNPGKDKSVFIRGALPDYTLILVDGVPVNDPSGAGGVFDIRLFPLQIVERIEILKGSQSTLYGSDAIAGVINIITKHPDNGRLKIYGGSSVGSYSTAKASVGIRGGIKNLSYSLGYQAAQTEGLSEAKDTTEKNNFDKDGYKQKAFQAAVSYLPAHTIKITPFFRYTNFNGGFDADAFTDAPNTFKSKLLSPGILTQAIFKRFSVNVNYTYNACDRIYKTDYGTSNFQGRFHNLDAYGSYKIATFFQILAGYNYQNFQMLDTAIHNPQIKSISPYVTFLVKNYHGFSFEAGYRKVMHSKYGSNHTYSITPAFELNSHIKFFASLSTGFKAPTLYQLFGEYGANEKLKPQESTSYEAGLQTAIFKNKVQLKATAFKRKIKNQIIYTYSSGYLNQDKQEDHGFEANANYTINKIIALSGWYAFVNGFVATKTNAENDTSFFNLIRRPKHSFGLFLSAKITPSIYCSIAWQYAGRRTDNFYNPVNSYLPETVYLRSYGLLNFYSEYSIQKDHFTIFVDIKNITKTKFTEVYGYNAQGINYMAGIHFNY